MLKTVKIALIPSALALPALAETPLVDANGDGMYSYIEITAAYPQVSSDMFAEMDGNGDELIDADELAAAQEAGLLPKS